MQAAVLQREDQIESWGVAFATGRRAPGTLIGWQSGINNIQKLK